MTVLAIDTATPYLVLGLPHAEGAWRLDRRHAEALFTHLEAFLQTHRVSLKAIRGIVVGQGPGSYTGVRIGVSAALGLGRALGVPVVGVDTLAGIALRYRGTVTPALSARSGRVYTATYRVPASQTPSAPHLEVVHPPHKTRLEALPFLEGCVVVDEPPSGRALAVWGRAQLQAGRRGVSVHYL
ncbi:tRNA (adenosine(37)-N6)-threonylcarbamoyltransferase complex dimerization subunit type 1 TsaB [Marinithermus hydrothermalis]|uniref:Universal protein YeaZ n=1 Tax=Marinithermus hydrothermalis (strain DSM 14884 / JCM 11576 / T1) TaxID=869210 RepID=F2NMB7_MARHT|nr:tRNA (adenosine(37)-N6)-threonylcarbamoyltransferase complex dimerization subunit type 1 TsaB [Marinithermus hydrothermalis]AEB11805.1 universal protein YeaZ [Marinithermus hydrothermalis DSM 14884]